MVDSDRQEAKDASRKPDAAAQHTHHPQKPVRLFFRGWFLLALCCLVVIALPHLPTINEGLASPGILLILALVLLVLAGWFAHLAGITLALGFLLVTLQLLIVNVQQLRLDQAIDLSATVRVISIPQKNYRRVRAVVRIEDGALCRVSWLPCRVSLAWYRSRQAALPDLLPGQIWRLQLRAKPPRGYANPGGFDYADWLAKNGIHATAYVRVPQHAALLGTSWRGWVNRLRLRLLVKLRTLVPGGEHRGLLEGLTVGVRHEISTAQRDTLVATGTAHLLAISGMHIGMVAGMMFMLSGMLWKLLRQCRVASANWGMVKVSHPKSGSASGPATWRIAKSNRSNLARASRGFSVVAGHRSRFASVLALVAATLYALLAGFTLPTQRALLSLLFITGLFLSSRRIALRHVLLLVFCTALLLDPLAPLSASVWLSFGAVAALIWLSAGRQTRLSKIDDGASMTGLFFKRWLGRIREAVRIQLALSLLLIPVSVAFFHQISLVGPVANLLAIPFVGLLVLPLIMAALAVLLLSGAVQGVLAIGSGVWFTGFSNGFVFFDNQRVETVAAWLLQLSTEMLALMMAGLTRLQQMPLATLSFPETAPATLVFATLAVIVATKPSGGGLRWLAIPLLLPLASELLVVKQDDLTVDVLDVGQGLAVVVRTRHHALLYDTGPSFGSPLQAAGTFDRVVRPFFRAKGIERLDRAIISHGDNDHAGGTSRLQLIYPQTPVMTASRFVDELQADQSCLAGQSWHWDGVDFEILHPAPAMAAGTVNTQQSDNNLSCVLLISYGSSLILLPGDIEYAVERKLRPQLEALNRHIDLLVVPHHGSSTSSTAAFVHALQPRDAVFSVGWNNRYGFPDPEVVMRYKREGSMIFRTDRSGALRFRFDADGRVGEVIEHRQQRKGLGFWTRDRGRS